MNTVTLSLEDYNELKAKADAMDKYMKDCESFANNMREAKESFKIVDNILDGKDLIEAGKRNQRFA